MSEYEELVTTIIMNDQTKAMQIEYEHYIKHINFICDNVGDSIRGSLICDSELTDKFGSVLDHFSIQDGDTKNISSNHEIIKELINLIMKNFLESSL